MKKPIRLAYLVSHPIQYQVPLLRYIAKDPDISLKVYFCSDFSTKSYFDKEFGVQFKWDLPLLDGYRYEYLPSLINLNQYSLWKPFSYGLHERLVAERTDVLWVHGHTRWFHLWSIIREKQSGIKILLRDEATQISARRSPLSLALKRFYFSWLKKYVDGFLAIGSLNRAFYQANGIAENRIFLFPYAVDNDFFQIRARVASVNRDQLRSALNLDSERPVILYASKISARKRPGDLLNAYLRLSVNGKTEPEPYLLFVGDGDERKKLEALAMNTGWNSIRFLGFKNQQELPPLFDLCDVFVLPSTFEPWGLVVNEAMNAGKAVIVSDQVGASPDLITHGKNGYIFKAGDISQLTDALKASLSSKNTLKEMGKQSLEKIDAWSFREDLTSLKTALHRITKK